MRHFQEGDFVEVVSCTHWGTGKTLVGETGIVELVPEKTGGRPASRVLVEFDRGKRHFVGKNDLEKIEETVAV